MNKVFKVVYSKSKGCYVVVPETAKNNNGKKKVLASVLAGLAVAGAMGGIAPQEAQAGYDTGNSHVNIWADTSPKSNGQNYNVGQNSIVVGYQNTTDDVAGHDGKVAIGAKNTSTNNASTAVGNENKATGGAATAVGAGNTASGKASVALGNVNNADAKAAIAIGTYNNVNYTKGSWQTTPKQAGEYSTVVGNYSSATGQESAAMGVYTNAAGAGSFAAGYSNNANGQNSVAIGSENTSHVADTITLGQSNNAKTMGGISIGKNNLTDSTNDGRNHPETRDENSQIAIGRDNTATHLDTIAIGRDTHATGSGATALGARADASGNNSIAIGQSGKTSNRITASGENAIAIGMRTTSSGASSIAQGAAATATGDYAIAEGRLSKATKQGAVALGNETDANFANGVALGDHSVTTTDKGVLGYNPSDPHERKYAPLTGNVQTATTAAVSIGNGQQMTRQLTGLAAGTADTDAVNVAQLKNVGVAVTGNTGKSDFLTDGGKLNVIGTGRVSTVAAHDGAKDSRITVGFDDTGMIKAGKNVTVNEETVGGKTTYTINAADTAAKYDFLTNATANGGKVDGTAKPATVQSGTTINYAAGKNLTVKQDIETSLGQQTYTYSLNKDLKEITSITNNGGPTMNFGSNNISITGGNLDLGDNNITNLKSGGDVINNAANIGDVTRISKANEKHIKPGEYAVDNNGKVTMTYVDGNNKDVPNETAVITGIAKQDLSNINNGGKTVIKNLAKEAIDMENGKNTTASHRDVNGVKTFKVDVEGDLTDITSITNKAGDGKIAFGGNQTVNVAGDHNIAINAKAGDITGLTNVTLDAPDFAKKGRAATEEQLNIVNNKFNNTVGLTGNTGATELQKLNKQGGLSFGVVGANNGEYIKTTAAGSDVVADLSDSAKNKLNSTVEVQGKNAAKVTSTVVNNADGSTKTIYTVDVNNVKPTAASTEKVQAKADVAGSSDKNIAKVSPKAGENFGDAGATYEVNVSRNDVKDAAREAVTVNNANNNNNPITVTPVQDEANHNTNYQVTFDGDKAAKQIPLTYKANGQNAQTVTLDKGLNFTNGKNTTASVDAEGVVKYDVNKDLVDIHSISNTTNGPKMEFGPNSINITNGPINMGDQNITNLKSGGDVINNAANIGDVKRISKANDLHIAPTSSDRQGETTTSYAYDAASKSVTLKYNDGNGANQSGTVAKIDLSGLADQIKDGYSFSTDAKGNVVGNHAVTPVANGKTVSYAAGKNLTVAQNIDNATGEHTYTYALSNDVDLTPNGSLKIGDTILNNGGLTITGGPSVTKTGINAGNLNITNVKAGVNDTDAVNVKQLKDARTVVTSNDNSVTVNKTENGNQVTYDLHVAPGAAQSVWNVKSTGNTTADSEAAAKTITDGKTVEMAAGKNLTVKQTSNNDGAKVEFGLAGDLTNIKTIKNEGPATFTIGGNEFKFDGGNVNMGDNNITNLKSGGDVINNAANIGDVKRISKANDIHIKDKTYTVNADKTVTLEYVDGNDNAVSKTAKIDLSNLPTGDKAAVESVVKKSAAAGDTNIADITVADGKQTGDANAKYEVNVSRNAVKDAAREAVTVNNANNSNNPITVTPVQDEANHNTTYQVTFDGDKAAKQIPLTYKANGSNDQKVTLDKGLNFTNGSNTTASVAADGVVKYDLNNNVNLTPSGSLTIGDTVVNNGGLTISGGPSVTKTGINAGNLNITNVKAGVNDTDAVNVKQLKDARTVVTSNDNSVTVNKTENGNQVTYDLHVAPGAAQSVWNVKSSGNTTADSETAAKTISDGKTVEMVAGKNLTVKQTSNNDGAKVEYALSDDIKVGNDGKDGKDGVDGKIGVNGKDGSAVVINGKDGSIGLNGKDGKDGLTIRGANGQDGVNGTNGTNGITRIVYEDKNNNKHEVATTDDGLKFTGNNTDVVNKNKLNSLVKVQGEGVDKTTSTSFKSASGNINVKADGTDTLEVQLNKDLKNITSIKNDGPATFTIGGNEFKFDGGNVNMGDNNITNLKSGGDVINNAANIGDVKRISKANDIHIKDKTYTVNADKTVTLEYVDGNDNAVSKTAKIDLSNLPTGDKAAVESVVKKSAAAGDTNIADITVADGKQTGDANAKYEVNVSRNAVKDAAREAVTVNNANNSNNPITVTPVQDEANHNTTYQVTFDGDKAAKQIPLTYKANGSNDQKVTLDKGLNFTNGSNTTASVAADGVVKYDLNNNVNLTPSGSLTIGDTVVNDGGLTINNGPSITKGGINAGNLNITNVKAGVNDNDAVNVKQLKDSRTVVTSNDKSVTINKTENGNQVTYDLHVAPGAAQSTWNVKSSGNTTADSETAAKTITDGKTVEMTAGKNLTVKQTSNEDGAKVEYALSDDIKVGNDGKDGKDGVDGKIGVNGKDGSAVVINGKDGSIGLNGKDGKDGLTIRGANGQDGVNGTNGTNGITRIVYEDKNNNKHEVATTDDGLKFTGNNTDVVNKNKLNSLVKVQGEGVDKTTSTSFKSASGNINVKADGTDTLEVQLNKDLKNISSIKNDGPATMTIGGNEFKFDGGNVNMGGNNITNLKSGGDVIDNAANIGDVTRISKANDLHIAPTKSDRAGEATTSYSYDAADKSVTLKYNDGNGANQAGTIAKIDLSGLADQIKDGYSFSTDAKGNVVGNHAVTAVGNGKTVSYAAGDNLTITQNIDNATGEQTYTYALSNDIKVGNDGKDGKDGVDGKIGVNGKDGSAVVINGKDGSIGLNGKDGKDGLTIKGANGQDGVDGKNGQDGMTRIVYEDKNNNKHEVATTDDGMKYAGDNGQTDSTKVIAKKLNQTLDITGGADSTKLTENNIGVNNVDGKLKVQLAQNINLTPAGSLTIGDTKITDGGLVINNGPSITKGGINAGDLNITNVKAGVNDTDAVNVKQLKSAKTEVKAGDNVTVDKTIGADGQNIYTVNAKATNLGDAELNYTANGGAKQKVKLSEGLNFVDGNYTKASVDANGVVKYDVTLGKVKDGVDGKPGVDGENGIATVKTVVDTINNSGWKGDVTGNTVGDHSATIVKPGTTVNFGAGKNLTVEQIVDKVTGNHTYNYALSDDIKVGNDGKDGKPGVDGKIGVNGKDGSAVVINGKDGSIGLNGKDGKDGLTFKGANGQDGVDGKNGTNGMTRIVYEDSNKNKHEVATTDDGLKFTGNNESVVNKNKLNSTVKVKGEGVTEEQEKTFESAAGNIAVTADGNDTLNIRLNKNIKGIDSIQTKEIHLGTPDNYTTIKKDGDRIKYGDKTFANTDDIWTIQANGTDVPANGGKVNVKGADGITVSKSANGEMTISGAGLGTMNSFNVKSSGNTTADSETAAKKITDGKTVEFSGGKNLTVKQTSDANGAKVEYALSNNVDLTNKGSVTIGDTKITDGGLVINNGPSVTKDGINAGNKQITNVEDGVNDTDAVNVRQLKAAKTNLVDGQNTKVTGDGSKANPYKVNVEGDLNKITSITNNEGDGKLEFKGDQVVNVAGDNTIKLDGKTGDITGLTNKTLDSADFATKGRAATEEQLKLVQQEAAKKSTEKVQAKADANNIAKVAPKAGDTFGAAGATYEVSVDKNDVKDAAREAVTVTGDNKAITVDVQPNATNHTTNYQVNFNGKEAAKQIPLTYKENGGNARTVMLSEGLDFSNGVNTTAHTDANGKVSFDVKGDLTNITSISNNSNGPKVSFGGDTVNITGGNLNMGGNKITNVQKGTNDTDAVNVKQLKDSRTTLTSDDHSVVLKKTESADGGLNYDLSVKGAVDPRVDQLNEEIGRVGAQGAALSALKPMQYDPLEPTQIMAGYGNYRGNSAIAVGVAHYKNESTMFHGGLSWAGGSSHMMANAGVTWKVGNRDAEAAVADRYRKGPISSAYAVQTEMAAMKAQNAGLKGEVSDLKYENEQIKAQNAGLQSEVEVLKAQMAAMMAKMGM